MNRPRWGEVDLVRVDGQVRILDAPRWIAVTTDLLNVLDPEVVVVDADGGLTITAVNRVVHYRRLGLLDLGLPSAAVEFERVDEPIEPQRPVPPAEHRNAGGRLDGAVFDETQSCGPQFAPGAADRQRAAVIVESVREWYRRGGGPARGGVVT